MILILTYSKDHILYNIIIPGSLIFFHVILHYNPNPKSKIRNKDENENENEKEK